METPSTSFHSIFVWLIKSWNNKRAITYRKINNIPDYGTAVNIQSMVFGNKGWNSGTGVATNIQWSIDLEGGLILLGKNAGDTIPTLAAGASETSLL